MSRAFVHRHSGSGLQREQFDPAYGPRVRVAESVHGAACEEVSLPRAEVYRRLSFDEKVHRGIGRHEHMPERFGMTVQGARRVGADFDLSDARLWGIENACHLYRAACRIYGCLGESRRRKQEQYGQKIFRHQRILSKGLSNSLTKVRGRRMVSPSSVVFTRLL